MPRMTGSRLFAEMMRGYGVSHIFFVPAIMIKAMAEMEDMPIDRIMAHGEKAAAYMADGYARASGKPGVCMAQSYRRLEPRRRTARWLHGGLADHCRHRWALPRIALPVCLSGRWRISGSSFRSRNSCPRRRRHADARSAASGFPRGNLGRAGAGAFAGTKSRAAR